MHDQPSSKPSAQKEAPMSRTTLPDGSVRLAPDLAHRSKRKVPASQVAIPLAVAAPVGLLGARGTGLVAALIIAAVTALVTLVAVLVWRLTLPRQVSVTVSPTQVTYRRYGRTNTVDRGPRTRAAVRTVLMQAGLQSPYLIASCNRDGFLLNLDMWAEDELHQIAAALGISSVVPPDTPTTVDEVRDEFPGAMSFHLAHPNWTAIIVLVVAVPVVAVVMWASGFWSEDDVDYDATQRQAVASQVAALPPEVARTQDDQLTEAQSILSPDSTWESRSPDAADCEGLAGWQRVVIRQSADGTSAPAAGVDPARALTELAEAAGMTAVVDQTEADGSYELHFQDAATGAYLRARGGSVDGSDLSVESGSACTIR
jgi:hypothetical protein